MVLYFQVLYIARTWTHGLGLVSAYWRTCAMYE